MEGHYCPVIFNETININSLQLDLHSHLVPRIVKTLIHSGCKNILLHQLLQLIPLMPELPGQLDRVAGVVEEGHGRWHGVQSITGFIETVPITGVRWVH